MFALSAIQERLSFDLTLVVRRPQLSRRVDPHRKGLEDLACECYGIINQQCSVGDKTFSDSCTLAYRDYVTIVAYKTNQRAVLRAQSPKLTFCLGRLSQWRR
jgi:hypothetical protein